MFNRVFRSGQLAVAMVVLVQLLRVPLGKGATKIAFVPAVDGSALPEPIPSMLFDALAATKDIQAVEREKVRDCLDELKLTAAGLADSDAALHLGKILAADLIVTGELVGPEAVNGLPPTCEFRVIDSRTGIVLRDSVLLVSAVKADVSPVVRDIVDAAATSQLPEEKRKYVSIVAVSSEEPGSQLDPVASSLAAFLEHDLSQTTGVIVLERQQLQKLTQERDLTGLDQHLKTSTVLIDAGVRRGDEAQQVTVTLKLRSLAEQAVRSTSFSGPMGDMIAIRQGVVAATLKAIDAAPQASIATDPAVEAAEFARRAAHLLGNKQKREAAACAEAAIALDPSAPNLALACQAWESMTSDDTWPPLQNPPILDELRAGIRGEQIKELQRNQIIQSNGPEWPMQNIELFSWALRSCQANLVPSSPDTPEHKLWRELKDACLKNYSAGLEFTLAHKGMAIRFYSEKLGHIVMLSESQQERENIITETIAGVDAERDAGRTDDSHLAYFYSLLPRAEERYGSDKSPVDHAFWRKLTTHREPYVRMTAYRDLMSVSGEEGAAAGVKLFDTILKESPADALHTSRRLQNETTDGMVAFTMRAFAGQADAYFEDFLSTAEKNNDSNSLVRWPFVVAQFPALHPQSGPSAEWRARILALLDRVPPDQALAANEQYLKDLLRQQQSGIASRTRPPSVGTGAWSRYRERPIAVKNLDPELNRLCGFDLAGEKLIGVWCNWTHNYADATPIRCMVAQLPVTGGELTPIAMIKDADPTYFTCINCSPDGVCIAQKKKGIFVVCNGNSTLLEAKDGLPAGEVTSAAWLNGLLYLGFDGGITQYDPKRHSFKVLASAKAVNPKGPLDGGADYSVAGMISDAGRRCLWLTILGNNNPRVGGTRPGLWKFDPDQGKFTQSQQGDDLGVLQWTGDKIVYGGFRPTLFDPATGTAKSLTGYNKWTMWLCRNERNCALFQTDFLFELSGYICAPDNLLSEMPRGNPGFDLVTSGTHGFIVGDSHTGKLYSIEPTRIPNDGPKPQ